MIDEAGRARAVAGPGDASVVVVEPPAEQAVPVDAEAAVARERLVLLGRVEQPPAGRATWRLRIEVESLAWAGVVALAALLRLPSLSALPLTVADSGRAFAAWQVAAGRLPSVWNGDIAQTATALLFKLFGAGDGLARLIPALLGIGLVASFWLYRPLIGRAPALLAALAIALSPVCVAVSRSLSPYAAGALFALLAAAMLLDFLRAPRSTPLLWLAGLVGLGLATDASFLVFLLAAGSFCAAEALWKRRPEFQAAGLYLRTQGSVLRGALLIGAAGLLLATTRFGVAPERLRSAATASWSDAFNASSAAAPWHFPLDALLAYDPLLFLGGLAAVIALARRAGRAETTLCERLLLYWTAAGLGLLLVASQREMGQIPILLVPLALALGGVAARWLGTARWPALRPAVVPVLLALPALVYVLFVIESAMTETFLSPGQNLALVLLLIGGLGLLVLGGVWSRESAPAFAALCGLAVAVVFGLHSATRVGFQSGDEFLLGPQATANAPALAQEVAHLSAGLRGTVNLDPSLVDGAAPLAWYTRNDPAVRIQAPSASAAGVIQSADRAAPPGFVPVVLRSEIGRRWYPGRVAPRGILRWLLYRQAWEPAGITSVQLAIRGT